MTVFPRSFYVSSRYERTITDDVLGIEVYADRPGTTIMIFIGRAQKPRHHYHFSTKQKADDYVDRVIARQRASIDEKKERLRKRREFRHNLEVGNLLKSSWGYDQTNINFYEITGLVGTHTVELRELAQTSHETAYMQGRCAPLPGQYIGKKLRRKVTEGNTVKIDGSIRAWKLNPEKMVGTVPVYGASHFSTYA